MNPSVATGLDISVVICTRNPNPIRFARTLAALAEQQIDPTRWELIVVDNGSEKPVDPGMVQTAHRNARIVLEPTPGLANARESGIKASNGLLVAMVDDDNVLDSSYLTSAISLMENHPGVGTAGGIIRPEFESPPPAWFARHHESLLALRDLGPRQMLSSPDLSEGVPSFVPFGAGMIFRREAIAGWLDGQKHMTDRVGTSLASCGDTEMVLSSIESGWATAYFPSLRLTHLIPKARLDPNYLARLAYESAKTYASVLSIYGCQTRPRISRSTLLIRKIRSYLKNRAWSGPDRYIAWRSASGQFEALSRITPGGG